MEFEFIHNCSAGDLKQQVQYALDAEWQIITVMADQGSGYSVALQRPKQANP